MKLSASTGIIGNKLGYREAITILARAGFDAFDIDMCTTHLKPNELSNKNYLSVLKELKDLSISLNIECNQAHAPFPTQLNGNEEYNQKTLDMIIRSMECASFLGAKLIVMHPIKNSSSTITKDFILKPFDSKQQLFDVNVSFFRSLIPYCEKFNIKIAVENMWERHPLHRDTLIPSILGYSEEHTKFIDTVGSDWIVGCLDIGHSLICGEKPQDSIRCLTSKRLKALHIHDCNGYEDLHAFPYSFNTEWDEIINSLADIEYDGDFTFEADNFFKFYPQELYLDAVTFMCKIGRYMINTIENKKH